MRALPSVAIVALLSGVLVACTPPEPPPDDIPVDGRDDADGMDTEDAELPEATLALELGPIGSGDDFQPYGDPVEIELVRGFQGGYHLEPSLRLSDTDRTNFTADVRYVVRRTSNGRRLNRRSQFEIDANGWNRTDDGWVHHSNPVILAVQSASDVVGDEVELQVFVDVQSGGFGRATAVGTVVDDENNGLGPGPDAG